jgi:hypothetical protein
LQVLVRAIFATSVKLFAQALPIKKLTRQFYNKIERSKVGIIFAKLPDKNTLTFSIPFHTQLRAKLPLEGKLCAAPVMNDSHD